MQTIKEPKEMQDLANRLRLEGRSIGFVPTMGAFHEGHLSLMRRSRAENEVSVVSIFVNPTQFCLGEDYEGYPRDTKGDKEKAERVGVDYLFSPSVEDMYPEAYSTFVNVDDLTETLCGPSRPGHFRGVATVVTKLFNIVKPHRAYFGQKDYQQALVIKRMVSDLNMDIEIVVMPIVREKDGLAMSSRNAYLSPKEREAALILSRSLSLAEEMIKAGERDAMVVLREMTELIQRERMAKIDYVAICHPESLEDLERVEDRALIALAVKIGKARLIDNCLIMVDG